MADCDSKIIAVCAFNQLIFATSRGTLDARLFRKPIELKQTTYSACVKYRARFDLALSRADPPSTH